MVKDDFYWQGGRIWLDLVNTERMRDGVRVDLLADTGAMRVWLENLEPLGEQIATPLATWPEARCHELLEHAQELRAQLRTLCEAWDRHPGELPAEAIASLNRWLRPPAPGLRIIASGDGWRLEDEIQTEDVRQVLFPIARAAAQSITSGELKLLRRCGNPNCIRWFLDTSKNHSRRWCSMETCGNRHKVAEHYRKQRAKQI